MASAATAFAIIVFGTVMAVTGFSNWATKVSMTGKYKTQVNWGIFALAVLFAAMSAGGAWAIFIARHPLGFVNMAVLCCGSVSVLQQIALSFAMRKNYGEAEMRSVIARDI